MRPTSVTQSGVGNSVPMVHDFTINPTDITLSTVVTPPVNYTIQHTFDDVFSSTYNPATGNWFTNHDPLFNGATTNQYSKVDSPIRASRINNNGSGTVVLTAIQGIKG